MHVGVLLDGLVELEDELCCCQNAPLRLDIHGKGLQNVSGRPSMGSFGSCWILTSGSAANVGSAEV